MDWTTPQRARESNEPQWAWVPHLPCLKSDWPFVCDGGVCGACLHMQAAIALVLDPGADRALEQVASHGSIEANEPQ